MEEEKKEEKNKDKWFDFKIDQIPTYIALIFADIFATRCFIKDIKDDKFSILWGLFVLFFYFATYTSIAIPRTKIGDLVFSIINALFSRWCFLIWIVIIILFKAWKLGI